MQIKLKRIYEPSDEQDGVRILVDRLWPRGLTKQDAKIDLWPKLLTPSNELRKWYQHDLAHWDEFQQRYLAELALQQQAFNALFQQLQSVEVITLLSASKHVDYSHMTILKSYLQSEYLQRIQKP